MMKVNSYLNKQLNKILNENVASWAGYAATDSPVVMGCRV